jgi:UPF0042 nucleotide-binding protein
MKLVIVTGLSGSGKSIALHTLEDLGFYCIDNLPIFLLQSLARELTDDEEGVFDNTAVGIDARNRQEQLDRLPLLIKELQGRGVATETLFLEAEDDVLIRRYSETRRRHPLSSDDVPLEEAIRRERAILQPFLTSADLVIDTSHTNQHQLRDIVRGRLNDDSEGEVSILFESFGFKHGVPKDADFVYDMRCLPNPHWERDLRPFTGRDAPVREFLEDHQRVRAYRDDLIRFLEEWIPRFAEDGRGYLTVALGCTGGQHRSVYMAEALVAHFRSQGVPALIRHRELP